MSRSWNPAAGALVARRRRTLRVTAMALAILLLAITNSITAVVLYDRQAVRVGVANTVSAPYSDNGMTLELRRFEIAPELPGVEPGETHRAPEGTTFVVVAVVQRVLGENEPGSCDLALGRGEQRWTQPLDALSHVGTVQTPDLPEETACLRPWEEPPPTPGQEHLFGAVYLVPTELADAELRPVVTVQGADLRRRPDEVWL